MQRFRYVAFTADGRRENGRLDVATEAQAWEKLSALGLTVVELLEDSARSEDRGLRPLFQRGVPLAVQAELAEQLAVLFSARLTTMQIVDVVAEGAGLPAVKRQFRRVAQLMADGLQFPEALSQAADGLSPLFLVMARVGQRAGDPAPLMRSLATTLRRQEKMSSQIGAALIYPLILVIGGFGVFVMMALYLAPRLGTIFTSVNRPMPTELAAFIVTGNFLVDWGVLLALICAAMALALPVLVRRYRSGLHKASLRLPGWGPIASDGALSRLSRSLQLMLEAQVPLAEALTETASAMPENPFADLFHRAGKGVEDGGFARDVFAEAKHLPPLFRELFAIGERSNTLPMVMASVAGALEDRVERHTQRVMTLVTPILTLVIGGMIALLVYAVMGALLSVNDLAF
jgi:general secretion pathway protein F